MGASDSIVLDDPRGPSSLLSCQKLCVLDKFSLWIVCWLGASTFLMQSLLQSFCYGDNECLLSSHVKCSEVCFEKGVWVLVFLNYYFFCSLSLMVGTGLCTSSQPVFCSAVVVL